MKKFNFRLEPVLKYQNDKLEVLKGEHAKILSKIVAQEEKISDLENQRSLFEVEFNNRKLQGITPAQAINYQNYLYSQNVIIKKEYSILDGIKEEESKKREEVLESKKEALSIEKLKEIKVEEYRKEVAKANELFIEEFVSNARALGR